MATKKQPTTATTTRALPRTRPCRMVENFHLVWLDESIDEVNSDDCRNSITQLRQVVNTVNIFTDVDECIDFITDIKEERTFMVVSKALSEMIMPNIQEISQISSIYIFCENEACHTKCAKDWPKVKGVYTDIILICDELKQAAKFCDHNSISISLIKTTDGASKESLDTLDSSFMYTQIFKEILLTINFEQENINKFLTYCREQFAGNSAELRNVEKLRKQYHDHQPIWWYTSSSFLYSMLNRALRLMEVDLIIQMGFFIRDLHNNIAQLHVEQYGEHQHSNSFTVYHGQGLSQTDFEKLNNTTGGLISFNKFLSTSVDRAVSLAYAESNQYDPNLIGVLFEITIDTSIPATPFANVENNSPYSEEKEILFSTHSVFRIGQVKQLDQKGRLWQVDLIQTGDNDPQLHALTECMRKETFEGCEGCDRLGMLLVKLGHSNKAEELYEILLIQTANEREKPRFYHTLGMIKNRQGKYAKAVEFHEKAIKINQEILPPTHASLATSYNNIGIVYDNIGDYSKALSYYEKALEIRQKTHPANHPDLAASYNAIGSLYHHMGEYSKTLSYYEKALKIHQKVLPENHPNLATSYNNIGSLYYNMGDYSKALSYYEKALEIQQKTLPANHPDLATSHNNIGGVYRNMGEYSKALSYYEKALEIQQKILPENHPDLATSYNNIGSLYYNIGEYSQALSYYEKALEIYQKTHPANHPNLATSYNNIGLVYYNMGDYSKALSYYEKALEIQPKTLPANHPNLATSYNNIGSLYYNMGDYSKALSYYEKALEIRQKTLPENHPDFAQSYNNIGELYRNMGEYSKTLSYYEKALEIQQKILPENHPDLATSYNNIGSLYYNMGDYSKALSYYGKALEIRQKTLPENHHNLATSYNNIGIVCDNIGDYSKALSYYEKALGIRQKTLPANHPNLATSYNNIGGVYNKMGDYSKALSYYKKALEIYEKTLPADHPFLNYLKNSIKIIQMMNFFYLFVGK